MERRLIAACTDACGSLSPLITSRASVTDLFKGITNSLDEAGYKWDVGVYDAADYGAAQTRKRMIVRAVLDGELDQFIEESLKSGL